MQPNKVDSTTPITALTNEYLFGGLIIVSDCEKRVISFVCPSGIIKHTEIKLDNISPLKSLAMAPNGSTMVIAELSDGLTLVDIDSQSIIKRLAVGSVNCVSWSGNGQYISSGSISGHVITIDASTFSIIKKANSHAKSVTAVVFSPSSRVLVSASEDCSLVVHKAPELSKLKVLRGHVGSINCAAFLTENQLISGGKDKALHVWNVLSGETIKVIKEEFAASINCISVSPDGKYFLCEGNNQVSFVFESHSLNIAKRLSKMPENITSMAFIDNDTVILGVNSSELVAVQIQTCTLRKVAESLVYTRPTGVMLRNSIPDNLVSRPLQLLILHY